MDDTSTAPLSADTGGDFTLPDYSIDPADQSLADEIANFDPLRDTSGPVSVTGDVKVPTNIPATALPPHLSGPIVAAMNAAPVEARAAIERRMVGEALREHSLGLRVTGGAGPNANVYQREFFAVARDRQALDREAFDLEARLAEVDHWRPEFDAAGSPVIDARTGQQKVKAVDKVQGHARKQLEARRAEIERAVKALEGAEGQRRLQKALRDAVATEKAQRQQVAEYQMAERRAAEIVTEERVAKMAEAKARMLKSTSF